MKKRKKKKFVFNKFHLLTIASVGLFVGFWLGYFVFSSVHLKIICQPGNKVIMDTTRDLRYELRLNLDVSECKGITMVIEKPGMSIFFGKKEKETFISPNETEEPLETVTEVPPPPTTTLPPEEGYSYYVTEEPTNATRILTLDIFDICSGKVDPYITTIEGLEWCLNKRPPYYLLIEKNQTHIKTSFYGNGYNETYEIETPTLIFRLFAEDVSTAEGEIEKVEAFGDLIRYFSLGDYTLHRIWEVNPETGLMEVTRIVMSIPVYVDPKIPESEDWSNLRFYLTTSENVYYIGDVWFFVTIS